MNQKKNESNFFRAFNEIYKIKKIKGQTFNLNHKSVYCFLLNYQMMSGAVFPSYKHMQDSLGIGSDNTVKKYLDELESMGLVKSTTRKGTSKTYELVALEDFAALDTEAQQTRKQPNKNLHHKQPENEVEQIVVEPPATKQELKTAKPIKPDIQQPNNNFDFDDFLLSCDAAFEEYVEPKPKEHHASQYGRLCKHCYQNPNGDWDCADSYCNNHIPF
ncbi:helix-turn-helix domain-containing protein [Aeromonas schubertii]|uniref:helix-turn-helix domain-containing protein n=1 Tax=Aeromonas schubertii TaxID=652 RepID=UPI0009EAFD13|nr:helix-turn-helix domain-containing protein [Aeromonas schubertii]